MREVAVVGGGPRGVAVLERVVAHARSRPPGVRLRLHLVEPHEPGPGSVWRVDQPAELVMNTDGSHVTLFPDPSVEVLGPTVPGPTLQEWCRLALALLADSPRADVDPEVARVFAEGPAPTRTELDPVRDRLTAVLDGAFPSRAVYGLYLRWFFGRARALLPDGVEMVVHRTRAVACAPAAGGRYRLDLADGTRLVVDAAVLATGWLAARRETRAGLRHLPPGNPLDQGLETVPPGTHLAVRGFGMNFFDAMVLLTVCRGGRFVPSGPDGSLSYRPSGAEPVLHVGSRRGVPFRGKAEGRLPVPDQRHLRAVLAQPVARGGVDFSRDVLPAIRRDAALAYYATLARVRPAAFRDGSGEDLAASLAAAGRAPQDDGHGLAAQLLRDPADRLDLAALARPVERAFAGTADLTRWLADHLRTEIAECAAAADSPVKMASRSLGDARRVLAPLVEAGGLDGDDHRGPYGRFVSFATMLAGGPPAFRLRELLALIEAGVVVPVGPDLVVEPTGDGVVVRSPAVAGAAARCALLLEARMDGPTVVDSADPLLVSLVTTGLARPHTVATRAGPHHTTGALDVVGEANRLRGADGAVRDGLHCLGIPTEGARAFTIVSPVRGAGSAFLREADRVAVAVLGDLSSSSVLRASARRRPG